MLSAHELGLGGIGRAAESIWPFREELLVEVHGYIGNEVLKPFLTWWWSGAWVQIPRSNRFEVLRSAA